MSGQVTSVPTTPLPEVTTQGPMGGGGALPDETGVLVEGGGPLLEEEGREALLELNCSMPCGNYTAPTNTSNVPGDSYYFYEVSTARPSVPYSVRILFTRTSPTGSEGST